MPTVEHRHPTINEFNPTGQRFLWSDLPGGRIALYRWNPPAGYFPVLILTHEPSQGICEFILKTFNKEYPLPCGCTTDEGGLNYDVSYSLSGT